MIAASCAHDALFRTLLDPYEAMFVAVRTPLSQRVVDARIVAATPHAAALFGYDTSTALEGQFTSLLYVLDDVQRARRRATLRALGQAAATECYEARIVRQTGEIQRVVKRVEQRQLGQDLVWITHLTPANLHAPFQPAPLPHTVPDAAMHTLFGWACLAEVDALLAWRTHHAYPPPPQPLGWRLHQARKARGLSLQQVAGTIFHADGRPISRQYLHLIERDQRHPTDQILWQLAAVLALDPLNLLAEAGQGAALVQAYLHGYTNSPAPPTRLPPDRKAIQGYSVGIPTSTGGAMDGSSSCAAPPERGAREKDMTDRRPC